MKHKTRMAMICLAAMLLSMVSGCRLARENAGTTEAEDRLIGVFLTTEALDLFDFEGYLNDHIDSLSGGEIKLDGNADEYQGRLYAELTPKTLTNAETGEKVETKEYVFPGLQGIAYFSAKVPADGAQTDYVTSGSDEAICDGHTSLKSDDQGKSTSLEGTVYVTPGLGNNYYFNPVYQSADGRVYAMAGSGFFASEVQGEGAVFSQTMDATYARTENGKTKTDRISVKLSISMMHPPEKIAVLQMGADGALILRSEYAPGEMPKSILPENNTEYFIVETMKAGGSDGGTISRKLYSKDDEALEAFFCREDGICVKQWVQINWKAAHRQERLLDCWSLMRFVSITQ